jgi:HlyD family secretion protein
MKANAKRLLWRIIGWSAVIAIAVGGYALSQKNQRDDPAQQYKTETVDRGEIVQIISANGTLNPVSIVNVGTQISGTIQRMHANFNDRVTQEQILAELDPAILQATLKQSQANLLSAGADLRLAQTKQGRTRMLVQKGFIAQAELDQTTQALEAGQAKLAVAKAQVERDEANLRYSVIRSPVSGVVIARNVDVGQTVAASFQTPTLFQIAQDLTEMQIDTSIAEADIGRVRLGQEVSFTVDTFADKNFTGNVKQIRLNPTIQQNVVAYNVVIGAKNADGTLLPGMTAHVQIATDRRDQALRVPNAALRFRPKEDEPAARGQGAKVYRLVDGKAVQTQVKIGIADNSHSEVTSEGLKVGDLVITRDRTAKKENEQGGGFRLRVM